MSSIIPTGFPAWTRATDHTQYGGDTNKTNWHSQGVTNARTDFGAEALCRLAEDLAASVRTAPWAVLTVQCDDASPGPPTILAVNQMTGVRITSYIGNAPPTGFPSAIRNSNGDVSIIWAASYLDDYGVSGSIHIVGADVGVVGLIALAHGYQTQDFNADGLNEAVRVKLWDTAGVAAVSPTFTVSVITGTS